MKNNLSEKTKFEKIKLLADIEKYSSKFIHNVLKISEEVLL